MKPKTKQGSFNKPDNFSEHRRGGGCCCCCTRKRHFLSAHDEEKQSLLRAAPSTHLGQDVHGHVPLDSKRIQLFFFFFPKAVKDRKPVSLGLLSLAVCVCVCTVCSCLSRTRATSQQILAVAPQLLSLLLLLLRAFGPLIDSARPPALCRAGGQAV